MSNRVPLLLSFVLVALATTSSAFAQVLEQDDTPVGALARDDGPPPLTAPPLWLSVVGLAGATERGTELRGMLELGATLEKMARPTRSGMARAKTGEEELVETTPPARIEERAQPLVRGPFARAVVRAALVAAKEADRRRDLDDLALRARLSGLLPELRVRLAHVLDQDQALSPTEYDPERVTSSGGTSLWIEGRATFRLDRLVFADDEVAIERLRAERERLERGLVVEVLRALDRWQRANATAADETLPPQERLDADLDAAAAEATLDVLTDGWFTGSGARLLRR